MSGSYRVLRALRVIYLGIGLIGLIVCLFDLLRSIIEQGPNTPLWLAAYAAGAFAALVSIGISEAIGLLFEIAGAVFNVEQELIPEEEEQATA